MHTTPHPRHWHPSTRLAVLGLPLALHAGCMLNTGAATDNSTNTDLSAMFCDDALVEAALDTAVRFPSFRVAKDATLAGGNKWREAHAEADLDGFGVTLIRGTAAWPLFDAIPWSGDMNEPSLLFFEKNGSDKDNWQLIGFGYAQEWEDGEMGGCTRPVPDCLHPAEFQKAFIVHEAGYHGLSGGWTLGQTSNLTSGEGTIDAAGCNVIDHDDLKTKALKSKHGRIWTTHVYLDPNDGLPMMSTFDPWRRDGGDGYQAGAVAPGTFYEQGQCDCPLSLPPAEPVSTAVLSLFPPVFEQQINDDTLDALAANMPSYAHFGQRFSPVTNSSGATTAYRVTELLWTSRIEDFSVRVGDEVQGVTFSGSFHAFTGPLAFASAVNALAALPVGQTFALRVRRDGATINTTFRIVN